MLGDVAVRRYKVGRVAIAATNVVAPMLTTDEVVVLFPSGVTR